MVPRSQYLIFGACMLLGFALPVSSQENRTLPEGLVDPRTRWTANYSLPEQGMQFPGLQSDFPIAPDCGEESYVGTGRLVGRRALITGGDSGIGRAAAIAYAREGADVVINYLPEEQSDADEVVAVIEATTESRIFTVPGDLRNQTFCVELVRQAAEMLGGLDILVSNAAYSYISMNISELSDEQFEQTTVTNIYAPFWLTRAARPLLQPGSSIIFTTSMQSTIPGPFLIDYSASKAWTNNFMLGLSQQLIPFGIRVNAVAPALSLTNLLPVQGLTNELLQQGLGTVPVGRLGQPVEQAGLFVGLAESSASFVSGAVWTASGARG